MPRAALDRAHWPLWETYAEVSEEARDLAYALRVPIVFKRWDEGWVIWDYRRLGYDRWKQVAEDHAAEDRHQERSDFQSGWYLWRDLERLPEEYYEQGEGYW